MNGNFSGGEEINRGALYLSGGEGLLRLDISVVMQGEESKSMEKFDFNCRNTEYESWVKLNRSL